MDNGTRPVKIFSGRNTRYLAEKIADYYGVELGETQVTNFSDGEFSVCYNESIRGSHIFIIQSTVPNADNILELLLMIDAAKRASAYKIIAVLPYFGYARQDRKDRPRVSIGAKLIADLLNVAGISRLITMDLHADQIQGFFDVPVDHLYASTIFVPYIQNLNLPNLVFASPDVGGTKRTNSYAKHFGTEMVICHKYRTKANEIDEMKIIGDVNGKDIILIDDMVDTAGTITKAADMMMDNGANSVRAFASHAILSGPAIERINKSKLTEIVFTDSVPVKQESSKITILPIAGMFADTIRCVSNNTSISEKYII